jgi:hypothetical protein
MQNAAPMSLPGRGGAEQQQKGTSVINEELPAPNIPLLRKAVEWAEAEAAKPHPQERLWDQSSYAQPSNCGTAYCIAGYAVINGVPGAEAEVNGWGDYYLRVNGEIAHWGTEGCEVLGLTYEEGDALFADDNDIQRVREVAEQIAARAGERL